MTEQEFDLMIKRALDKRSVLDLLDIELDYTPARMSRQTKKVYKNIKRTMFDSPRSKRIRWRYVVAAILGASLLAVGTGAYSSKYGFTMGDAKTAYVSVESSVDDKKTIEEVYELTYELEGYKVTRDELLIIDESIIMSADIVYKKSDCLVSFSQGVIGNADLGVNTENATIEYIDINGEESVYIDCSNEYGDAQMLIWTYDGYQFFLEVGAEPGKREFSKNQVIEMAETIQIKN